MPAPGRARAAGPARRSDVDGERAERAGAGARGRRGRPPSPAALWLALAAAAVAAMLAAPCGPCGASAADSNVTTCSSLEEEGRGAGGTARAARVLLLWESQPARAAAALLRATLLAAGHRARRVTLQRCTAAADLCALLAAGDDFTRNGTVAVAPAVAAGRAPCAWSGRALDVLAAGAAPVVPRLHARLTARADSATCLAPLHRLRDRAALSDCDFLTARANGDGDADVYVPAGEWEREARELARQLEGAPLRLRPVSRAELAERVAAVPKRSFLFLDAELWEANAALPLPTAAVARRSLLVADRVALLKHAPALYVLLHNGSFAPNAYELRAALAQPGAVEAAACALAPRAAGYPAWLRTARMTSHRIALAVVCSAERSGEDYELAVGDVALHHIASATGLVALGAMFAPEVRYLDCGDQNALADEIVEWSAQGLTWRIVGVAAPAEQAAAASLKAAAQRLPLVAYTPAAAAGDVPSATGGPGQLAYALHRLLAACGWRRLGLVSEKTPLADAVSAALRREGALLTSEVSAEAPVKAVDELRDLDTRVFFVNAGATTAARVLSAAAKAAEAGEEAHVWIVREYAAADDATAALQPLSLSFQWRGSEAPETNSTYLRRLEREWSARAWPPHAAAILDALLTIGEGFKRLITEHNETLDFPDDKRKLSYFWDGVRKRNISGVLEDLQYDAAGVVAPNVYLERWGSAPRPHRLRAWRAGEPRPPVELCPAYSEPPDDGHSRCWFPTGDPYSPTCRDAAYAGGAAAAATATAATAAVATVVCRAARRWLARRDRSLECATAARILTQREATFGELAPHLVARGALALGDELGAGRFGRVRRGELRDGGRRVTVAVKALREGASPAEEHQFLHEARLLAALRHERIVRFEGVSWDGGPPLLLMELALFGDLLQYLRARRHLAGAGAGAGGEEATAVAAPALTRLAREAAEALAHLAARGLVHRDVRAANCLVDARRSLKLADFGLARDTAAAGGEYACRGRALFPVLWMAPESLARGVATAASDAWAFGVLALELVSLGARPFGSAAPAAAARAVLAGGRPPLPRDASAETRALARACWRRDPGARPTAARMAAWLARRPTALRPALAPDLEEPDCDSGIGEPASEHALLTSAPFD